MKLVLAEPKYLKDSISIISDLVTDVNINVDKDNNKLRLTLKGDSKRTFNIALLQSENEEQKLPKLNFPLTIVTKTSYLDEAIEDAAIIGESVSLVTDKKGFIITSEGTTSNAKVEIPSDDKTKISIDTENKVKSKYSIEYLKKMIKASKLAEDVSIQFAEDYPLKLDYLIKDKLALSFILAPRVNND